MENIVIQFFNSIGVPGIILAIIYFIFNKQFISLIRSTDFDRLFYTPEKKFILRVWSWIVFIFITSVFQLVYFAVLYKKIVKMNNNFVQILGYLLSIIILFSLIIKLLRKRKIIQKLKKYINDNKITDALFAISYIGFIIIIATGSYRYTAEYKGKDVYTVVAVSMILFSFIILLMERVFMDSWAIENTVCYFINFENKKWYLIKPFNSNDFLLGNIKDEYSCEEYMVVSGEFLKGKVIFSEAKDTSQP